MIKFYINSYNAYLKIKDIPILGRFFVFNLSFFSDMPEEKQNVVSKSLRYGDATAKETLAGRFDGLDDVLIQKIGDAYELHDVGVSNGTTSLELLENLKMSGKNGELYISDKFAKLSVQRGFCQKVFALDGCLLSVYCAGVYLDRRLNWVFPVSRYLFYLFAMLPDNSSQKKIVWTLSPSVLSCVKAKKLKFIDYDVFNTRIKRKFTVVRCMNLLNLTYFKESDITMAIRNIVYSLEDGGLFLVGRTKSGGMNCASFYKKRDGRLYLEEKYNGGSEVDVLIESMED